MNFRERTELFKRLNAPCSLRLALKRLHLKGRDIMPEDTITQGVLNRFFTGTRSYHNSVEGCTACWDDIIQVASQILRED